MVDVTSPRAACIAIAVLLVLVGTVATGLLPSTLPFQALAGAIIVAGFGLLYVCTRE